MPFSRQKMCCRIVLATASRRESVTAHAVQWQPAGAKTRHDKSERDNAGPQSPPGLCPLAGGPWQGILVADDSFPIINERLCVATNAVPGERVPHGPRWRRRWFLWE